MSNQRRPNRGNTNRNNFPRGGQVIRIGEDQQHRTQQGGQPGQDNGQVRYTTRIIQNSNNRGGGRDSVPEGVHCYRENGIFHAIRDPNRGGPGPFRDGGQGPFRGGRGYNRGGRGSYYGGQGPNYGGQGSNYGGQGSNYGGQGSNYGRQGSNRGGPSYVPGGYLTQVKKPEEEAQIC